MLTISVVIPCYNAAAFVREAVASVWAQTHPVQEIVCVDDGSTDGTLGVLRALAAESPVPLLVLTGSNGGAAQARNRGTALTTGDYLQYLDADDVLLSEKLAHQALLVEAATSPPALVMAAHYEGFYAGGTALRVRQVHEDPWLALVGSEWGITSANLWSREAVLAVGGWNEQFPTSEDAELIYRLLKAGGGVLRDERPLLQRRRRPDSLWHANLEESMERWWQLRCEIFAHVHESTDFDHERRQVLIGSMLPHIRTLYQRHPSRSLMIHEAIVRGEGEDLVDMFGFAYAAAYRTVGFGGAERASMWKRRGRRLLSRIASGQSGGIGTGFKRVSGFFGSSTHEADRTSYSTALRAEQT